MKTPTRIYVVSDSKSADIQLVEAQNQAQAVRHVVGDRYSVRVASSVDVAFYMKNSIPFSVACKESGAA